MIENLKVTKENDTIHNDTTQKWPFFILLKIHLFLLIPHIIKKHYAQCF